MKPSLFLIDGMNIANRTMVAYELRGKFPKDTVEYYDCGDQTLPYFYVRMMRDVLEKQKSVIIESSWRDQYVLHAMGEPTSMPVEFMRMLDRIALGCDAIIGYCRADTNTYARNLRAPLSYDTIKDTVHKMHTSWEALDNRGLSCVPINTQDVGFKTDLEILWDRAEIQSRNVGPGIGRWTKGSVLIVGDKHGPSIQPYKVDMNIAFCDMAKAGSSFWLSQQLASAEIPERKLYWINAYNAKDEPTDSSFVQELSPISVISLGDNAARWCADNHIRHEQFQHPQYHKRFNFNEPYPLIARLAELTGELK